MSDPRLPFKDAKCKFLLFLESQGWPTDVLWLSRDRLTGHRRTLWVFRPEELISDAASREFYEAARRTAASIRIDAIAVLNGRTLAYVEDYGGESRMLNFGVMTPPSLVRSVSSRAWWNCLRLINGLLGHSPFLKWTRMIRQSQNAE